MQRTFDTFSIPKDLHITEARAGETHIYVTWSDGHKSSYSWHFLHPGAHSAAKPMTDVVPVLWNAREINLREPRSIKYAQVMDSEAGVARLTMNIRTLGFSFVTDTPYEDPNDTKRLLERIAFIRQTHYGGFYDFQPDLAMADTAYTNLALAPHTDNTYFTEPAGLQAFHCLAHEPPKGQADAPGGDSLLVDGFKAARMLAEQDPDAVGILSNVPIPWHASGNEGITIGPDKLYPVLEFHRRELHRIRWNNDDRGVVPISELGTGKSVEAWYEAARKWDQILRSQEMQYQFKLTPGTVLIFDNWRVLHGRTAFEGIRRICGGYINRDDFISRFRNTNYGHESSVERILR
ncbi:Trimethyllysine dioxygenase [Parathielavia hyrcaniae]|uniref:trimethyllysine dioxygenase n=1 Tax=Parathielavia hyrcaniae TaxID=113614 RepID=A0AAN6QCT1_9PEZI|nr:Trimethyllysine dioxygenase [Parathielavia hyrcaniae]